MSEVHTIGICTGGGDCPGLNAVIRAAVRTAKLECTRATLGRRVRCWLCTRSKSAISATTSRSR